MVDDKTKLDQGTDPAVADSGATSDERPAIICAGAGNTAIHTRIKNDEDAGWPEPEAVKFDWQGKTKDGKSVTGLIETDLEERLDRVDVMAEVPGFVKKIVGNVAATRPYIYQVCHTYAFTEFPDTNTTSSTPRVTSLPP